MICKKVNDKIPPLIRREIDTNERIQILNHLKECDICRNAYLRHLKIYYEVDKGHVNDLIKLNKNQFKSDLTNRLSTTEKSELYNPSKLYVYAAAVVLIFILISLFIFNIKEPASGKKQTAQIEQALHNEDWPILQEILKNDSELKKYANEKIPVSLLIEKLSRLEKQGVRSIHYIDLFNTATGTQNYYALSEMNKEIHQIQITKLVQTLEKFQSSKSEITLYEIGLSLTETNKGGINS
ncbi:MAG: zf-HC2 domain-containing protein [Calditrichaceae bacterium]|nr:zf-HC2 domain-containing protein [Calditrichaceae bacterium]